MIATDSSPLLASRIASCDAALRRSGATCTFVSDSGSRYFDMPGRGRVRVSGHCANGGEVGVPDSRWDAEVRVDLDGWQSRLNELATNRAVASDVPASIYFADHEAWSQSMLKTFLDRRRLAEAYYVKHTLPEPADTTPMRKGTATHTALLEPDRFAGLVITYPKNVLAKNGAVSTNDAKAFRDENEAAGRVVLKESEYRAVKAMADSVRRVCGKWLALPGWLEETIYFADEETGLPLKSRLDWRITTDNANIVIDLKSTGDASPWAFRQRVKSCRYWMQDAQYRAACNSLNGLPTQFYFAVVEDAEPFACALHRLDDAAVQDARDLRRSTIQDVAACLKSGDWSEPWESTINALYIKPWEFNPKGTE